MTIYDGVMAAVLIAAMARGAWRGITWQLASIGSLVLGYLFAYPISALIAPRLSGAPEAARAMSMGVAYVAVSCAVFGLAWMVRGTIRKMKFDAYDRHLGMMLGGVEGVAVGILGTMLVVSVAPGTRTPIFTSASGKVVNGIVGHVGPILPSEVRAALAPYWPKDAAAIAAGEPAPEAEEAPAEAPAPRAPSAVASRASARLDAQVGPVDGDPTADIDVDLADEAPALPSARQVLDGLVDHGKRKAEQAIVEALDTDEDPDGKAGSLRDLFERDKARLQDAVAGTVDETRRSLTGRVEEAVVQTKGKVVEEVQGRAGQAQGRLGDVQRQAEQVRSRIARTQEEVRRARQRLEQGADGAVDQAQRRLERSLTDAIGKGLDRLGLPDAPAPKAAP
ncbi:CvpA family protein [Paludisphaera sp.]|uniref:CvpA family protein n=1 Tax=Paludisphaera sp. TaxID=2017432 RepID=UPI00301D7393